MKPGRSGLIVSPLALANHPFAANHRHRQGTLGIRRTTSGRVHYDRDTFVRGTRPDDSPRRGQVVICRALAIDDVFPAGGFDPKRHEVARADAELGRVGSEDDAH
jgi:hypothetical protein